MRQVSTPSRCAEPLQPCTAVDFDVDDDESHGGGVSSHRTRNLRSTYHSKAYRRSLADVQRLSRLNCVCLGTMPLNAQQVDCVVPWPLFVRWFALHYLPPISWNDAREWLEWIDDVRACLCLRASHRQGVISRDVRTMWHFHIGGFNRYLSDCEDRFIRWQCDLWDGEPENDSDW